MSEPSEAPVPPTDAELMARYYAGDRAAFDQAMSRVRPRLVGFFVLKTRNPALADDLAQETLLKAAQTSWRFDPSMAEFHTWLFRLAKSVWNDQCRRTAVRRCYRTRDYPTKTSSRVANKGTVLLVFREKVHTIRLSESDNSLRGLCHQIQRLKKFKDNQLWLNASIETSEEGGCFLSITTSVGSPLLLIDDPEGAHTSLVAETREHVFWAPEIDAGTDTPTLERDIEEQSAESLRKALVRLRPVFEKMRQAFDALDEPLDPRWRHKYEDVLVRTVVKDELGGDIARRHGVRDATVSGYKTAAYIEVKKALGYEKPDKKVDNNVHLALQLYVKHERDVTK